MLKAIIVDDEEHASNMLEILLKDMSEIVIVDKFEYAKEALEYIKGNSLDVVFLDIEMPEINGLELAQEINMISPNTDIIFVTAFNQYAVEAFELNALDYLLKPTNKARVEKSVQKLINKKSVINASKSYESVNINSFDNFEVFSKNINGTIVKKVNFRTSKTEELLAYLYSNHDKTLYKEEIMENIFTEMNEEKATASMYSSNYYIRKEMNLLGISEAVSYKKGNFIFNTKGINCDLVEFEKTFLHKTEVNVHNIEEFEQASLLYIGQFLGKAEYDWLTSYRYNLDKVYIEGLMKMSEYYLNIKDYKKCIENSEKIIELDNLRERAHELLIKSYILMGDRMQATKNYETLRKILRKELGVKPKIEISKLMKF